MSYRIHNWSEDFENAASKKLKRLDWVAIPIKLDGDGYAFLVDHPSGAAHFGAWIAIVEIAAKQDPRGTLPDGIGGIAWSLSRISRLPHSVFEEVLPRLIELGWVEAPECYQRPTAVMAESADVLGKSADVAADVGRISGAHNRTLQDITKEKPSSPTDVGAGTAPTLFPVENPHGKVWFDASFDRWYQPYWNKTGKVAARKAYEKRIKILVHAGRTHEAAEQFLSAELLKYRQRFEFAESWSWRVNMHPASWLNGETWEDQGPDARASPARGADAASRIAANLRAMHPEANF
jgi:hypothetical protein